MCATRYSLYRGLCSGGFPHRDPPGQRPPRHRPPCIETPHTQILLDRDPLEGIWDQAARQEVIAYRDRPVDRMTDARLWKYDLAPNFVISRKNHLPLQLIQLTPTASDGNTVDKWSVTQKQLSAQLILSQPYINLTKIRQTDDSLWDVWLLCQWFHVYWHKTSNVLRLMSVKQVRQVLNV